MSLDARTATLHVLEKVLDGAHLGDALAAYRDHAHYSHIQYMAFGVMRYAVLLEAQLNLLLSKALKEKDDDIKTLLLLALFELQYTRTKAYAVVDESVKLCQKMKKIWAKGLVNACLRRFLREQETLSDSLEIFERYSHPKILCDELKAAYPNEYEAILKANQLHPPMTLRVNVSKITRDDYLVLLDQAGIAYETTSVSPVGVKLESPCAVTDLPGFKDGFVSVQDESAQFAAMILSPKPEESVLDACAAPGGKTCHLLEQYSGLKLTAVELSEARVLKIRENLERLGLSAPILIEDLNDYAKATSERYDAILLDAPCSALGVIRRHPDIKAHRDLSDVQEIAAVQAELLRSAWVLLKPGGRLLYATCSILPAENEKQMEAFLSSTPDARLQPIDLGIVNHASFGLQLLPGEQDRDGFYYCLLAKSIE